VAQTSRYSRTSGSESLSGSRDFLCSLLSYLVLFPYFRPQFNFAGGDSAIENTKRIMGPACKTLLWWSTAVSSMLAHLSDYDFVKIAEEIYADPARRDGRSLEDIVQQVRLFGSFPT
jgi:hypothetical protein